MLQKSKFQKIPKIDFRQKIKKTEKSIFDPKIDISRPWPDQALVRVAQTHPQILVKTKPDASRARNHPKPPQIGSQKGVLSGVILAPTQNTQNRVILTHFRVF